MLVIIRLTGSASQFRLTETLAPLLRYCYRCCRRASDAAAATAAAADDGDDEDDASDVIANAASASLPSPHNMTSHD